MPIARTSSERPGSQRAWSGESRRRESDKKELYDSEVSQKKGCWAQFVDYAGGLWATRQLAPDDEDRERYVRTTIRELVIYLLFLIILGILTFGVTGSTMYFYTQVLSNLFLDTPFEDTDNSFRGASQVMDFWRYTQTVMLDALYWEYWYDVAKTPTTQQDNNVLYENRLLGVPRMRQVKVKSDSCNVAPEFDRAIKDCYDEFSPSAEVTSDDPDKNGTAWSYHKEAETGSVSYWGKCDTYAGSGYYADLGASKNESAAILDDLREKLWIGRGTRAVFVDFTVYNANVNLFCIIKLIFEFPATGGVLTSWSFQTAKLLRYVTPFDFFILACELVFIFYIIYYIVQEIIEISNMKLQYFKVMWNLFDTVVIVLASACIVLSIMTTIAVHRKLRDIEKYPRSYANFESVGSYQSQYNTLMAICIFFCWFKLFKYISFNKTMTQLSSTLSRSSKDVAGFAIMFFIVFFAFAQLGFLLFGTQVKDFSGFINSVFSLLRTILGDFDFQSIEEANRVLGPIFFLTYVFFVFFVLLNMFLAIINDTYSEVKAELASQTNEFEIADYFKRGYNNLMGQLGHRDKLIDIENALKLSDTNNDGNLTFEEIRRNLKKCNFNDMEIEMFFAKFDTDGNRVLHPEEINLMLAHLEGKRIELDREIRGDDSSERRADSAVSRRRPFSALSLGSSGISQEEHNVLVRRVEKLEHIIGTIVNKIDVVLVKIDVLEKSKHKKKEAMNKMLDGLIMDDEDKVDAHERRENLEKLVKIELEKWNSDVRRWKL